jgi:hypothetical protein
MPGGLHTLKYDILSNLDHLSPLLALWLRQSLSSIIARPSTATSQDPLQRTALCADSDFFYVVTGSICVRCYAV